MTSISSKASTDSFDIVGVQQLANAEGLSAVGDDSGDKEATDREDGEDGVVQHNNIDELASSIATAVPPHSSNVSGAIDKLFLICPQNPRLSDSMR
uniref:Uncharacterized protein n=1 Tax=Globodera rostochiensis TaxID=31243 RepID=A0A914GYF6_GLORO